MTPSRRLRLGKETIAELTPDHLAEVRGGIAPPTLRPGCRLFSDVFSCFPTAGFCPPPPVAD